MTDTVRRPRTTYDLLQQGDVWQTRSGVWLSVAEMTREHRWSTAQFLMRRAKVMKLRYEIDLYSFYGAPDDECIDFADQENPALWMAERPLYRALMRDLPKGGSALAALKRRARHWSTCPMRLPAGHPERPRVASCNCIPKGEL